MQHLHIVGARLVQPGPYLQLAPWIRGDDDSCTCLENVFSLASLETFGHLRFGQVVASRAAAADIGLGQLHEVWTRDSAHEFARLPSDALGVGEMAGVVVRDPRGRAGIEN